MAVEAKYTVNGKSVVLSGPNIRILAGRMGDLAPRYSISHVQTLGGILDILSYHPQPREFDLPILVTAQTREALLHRINELLTALSVGGGTLVLTDGGHSRELRGVYLQEGFTEDGLEGLESLTAAKSVLTFLSSDPYWYETTPRTLTFSSGAIIQKFFPFFPLRLVASSTLDSHEFYNDGVESWPIWSVFGPGNMLTIENVTTGARMSFLNIALGVGDELVIDTRPGQKKILLNGENAYHYLDIPASSLWPIEHGDNVLRVGMNDIAIGTTRVEMSVNLRYVSL